MQMRSLTSPFIFIEDSFPLASLIFLSRFGKSPYKCCPLVSQKNERQPKQNMYVSDLGRWPATNCSRACHLKVARLARHTWEADYNSDYAVEEKKINLLGARLQAWCPWRNVVTSYQRAWQIHVYDLVNNQHIFGPQVSMNYTILL